MNPGASDAHFGGASSYFDFYPYWGASSRQFLTWLRGKYYSFLVWQHTFTWCINVSIQKDNPWGLTHHVWECGFHRVDYSASHCQSNLTKDEIDVPLPHIVQIQRRRVLVGAPQSKSSSHGPHGWPWRAGRIDRRGAKEAQNLLDLISGTHCSTSKPELIISFVHSLTKNRIAKLSSKKMTSYHSRVRQSLTYARQPDMPQFSLSMLQITAALPTVCSLSPCYGTNSDPRRIVHCGFKDDLTVADWINNKS